MADGFCRGRAIWSAKFVWPRDFGRGRAFVSRIDRTVGPFRYENSADRGLFFPGSCVPRERFLSRNRVNPAEQAIPSRLDRNGRPNGIARPKFTFARPRPMFGADCVFTPFSPSILS
ncbi:unnamed protein product [Microthlaspi erraticum]|uniref:Uncharacterized protein n=1 Tax=Microthlaspi erraticum TaxID=1685480 RepID=A0A6D2KG84_9BRAS|nr:unnamed protein product [Microthlaspi erraticum]